MKIIVYRELGLDSRVKLTDPRVLLFSTGSSYGSPISTPIERPWIGVQAELRHEPVEDTEERVSL